MYRIGVDPGLQGALALLRQARFESDGEIHSEIIDLADMPVMAGTGKRQMVNAAELGKILAGWMYQDDSGQRGHSTFPVTNISAAYLERVSAMPGQGVSGMFSFGDSFGCVRGVLGALQIPMVLVTPQAWKKRAGLIGKEKDAARTLAQQLFPTASLARKKDIGRADSILIARFGDENQAH